MIPMNIALRPTEEIKKIIQSQDNYHFVINAIVEEVQEKNLDPIRTVSFQENKYSNGSNAFQLSPFESEQIMIAIIQDESAKGWELEYDCYKCSGYIRPFCPFPLPLNCPKCGESIDFSDPFLNYEFYYEVYIKGIILKDIRKILDGA